MHQHIVYRNPIEAAFWNSMDGAALLIFVIIIVAAAVGAGAGRWGAALVMRHVPLRTVPWRGRRRLEGRLTLTIMAVVGCSIAYSMFRHLGIM